MRHSRRLLTAAGVLALLAPLALAGAAPAPETVPGPVQRATVLQVLAAGRLNLQVEGQYESVRLYGVSMSAQDEATEFLRARIGKQPVDVQRVPMVTWADRAQPEAMVYPAGLRQPGLSINAAMVATGYATVRAPRLPSYATVDPRAWLPVRDEAAAAIRGLWREASPGPASASAPWFYRLQVGMSVADLLHLVGRLPSQEGSAGLAADFTRHLGLPARPVLAWYLPDGMVAVSVTSLPASYWPTVNEAPLEQASVLAWAWRGK